MTKALPVSCKVVTVELILLVVFLVYAESAMCAPQGTELKTAKRAAAVTLPDELSVKDRVEVFEEVWRTIDEKYYDPSFNGVNWRSVHERYHGRLSSVTSDEDFYALLTQMVRELRDAHTRFRSPRQRQERKTRQVTSSGVSIGEVDQTPVVFGVSPDSESARLGVKPGMVVQTIDGRPFVERVAEARQEIGLSSSERVTRLLAYQRVLGGLPGTSFNLGLLRADGSPLTVTIKRYLSSTAPQVTTSLLPSGFGYIKFSSFRSSVVKQVKDALKKFKSAPGVILDLRGNGGGDVLDMLKIAGYFFNSKAPVGQIITRTGKPPSFFLGLVQLPKEFYVGHDGGQLYGGPVVILVNESTASAAETFSYALQENGRATIIGTQSCGCVLAVLKHREIRGGGELDVSEIAFVSPKGDKLEGIGITPNQVVRLTLADLQSHRDPVLEAAVSILTSLK